MSQEVFEKYDIMTEEMEDWVLIDGEEYRYPDLVSAFIEGLRMVRDGEKPLKVEIDNTGKSHLDYKKKDRVLYVSDLGYAYGLCEKQLWLKLQKAPQKELGYNEILMFQQGELTHIETVEMIKYGLDDYWEIVAVEKSVRGLGLIGRYDFKLRGQRDETVIVDTKSSRGKNFDFLDRDGCKPEPKAQVKGYIQMDGADYGILFYVDREGQNGVRQFPVMPEDMRPKIEKLKEIRDREAPLKMLPKIRIRQNKSANSIYIGLPWQCKYCNFLDISCEGALPEKWRNINGIVAKQGKKGIYPYKDKYSELVPLIEKLIERGEY